MIDTVGDMKIKTAISLAMDSVGRKEHVLLFSRYTDTIEALLYEYNNTEYLTLPNVEKEELRRSIAMNLKISFADGRAIIDMKD